MTETLDDLLNKTEALVKCGAGTFVGLAKSIEKPVASVYDWVKQRRFEPGGDVALRIQAWAAQKTSQLSMTGIENRRLQAKYRTAFREVVAKRKGRN